jgi:hypothetical protein
MKSIRPTVTVGFITLVITLSSCGSSSGTSKTQPTSGSEETSAPSVDKASSLSEFSTSIGCSDYKQEAEAAPFTSEWGRCNFDGDSVQAYVFPNKDAMASFFDTVESFGIVKEQTAIKDLFVFAPSDATKLSSLKSVVEN